MKAIGFNNSCFLEQIEMLLRGTRLAKRDEFPYYVYLYNVGELYVEVFYDSNTDVLEFMQAFTGGSRLLPYIASIPIASFL
jgi:hypothetical protein